MSVFHGSRYEDPEDFIDEFLRCMGTAGDDFKKRSFIYYLEADSVADEWYEDLPQAEKKDWETLEVSFFKRWPRRKQVILP